MRFSDLTIDFPGSTNRLYQRLGELRQAGAAIVDLVSANVTERGIAFPHDRLAVILTESAAAGRVYAPDSLGQPAAREAIARYEGVPAGRILLTPGTSVSYWYVFKLLCEAGDEVLCPAPSYPLFDYIARLAGVRVRHYRLDRNRAWAVDMESVEAAITPRTRAVVVISPHNPTGMVLNSAAMTKLASFASRNDLALIVDEVFRELVYDGVQAPRPHGTEAPLVFALNGFSKMFALPGLKIGWMAVSGRSAEVDRAMRTLEMISDTFLPVNEPAQLAVPAILEAGADFLPAYRGELERRRNAALAALGALAPSPPSGGVHMVLPVGREVDEDALALELLEDARVLVHPGYFYDVEGRHIVLAFVQEARVLGEALRRLAARLQPA